MTAHASGVLCLLPPPCKAKTASTLSLCKCLRSVHEQLYPCRGVAATLGRSAVPSAARNRHGPVGGWVGRGARSCGWVGGPNKIETDLNRNAKLMFLAKHWFCVSSLLPAKPKQPALCHCVNVSGHSMNSSTHAKHHTVTSSTLVVVTVFTKHVRGKKSCREVC